ncbi:TylF/MycF/NovP-related O-methyltransferase [Klenkia sp. LSe6-5]|uniref:TylF/MycF/NovP-related O-methyltransferase n=1 Tax=Klenkia sesuvii TaxID=3103137 RepID=A0ABU8DWS7_9ACTN
MPLPRSEATERLKRTVRDKLLRTVADGVRQDVDRLQTELGEARAALEDVRGVVTALREQNSQLLAAVADVRHEVVHGRGEIHGHIDDQARLRRRSLEWETDRRALRSSLDFVEERLGGTNSSPGKLPALEDALASVRTEGMYLEFGVATGGTLRIIAAAAQGREVFGFDSFEGLPERWRPGHDAGLFAMAELPQVEGAELVVGWFSDTLPAFLQEHPGPVAFLHLDADLYSSTRTVLEALGDRLRPGSVVLFDEYLNYPGWQEHEHKAWEEWSTATGVSYEYLGFAVDDEQLFLRIT